MGHWLFILLMAEGWMNFTSSHEIYCLLTILDLIFLPLLLMHFKNCLFLMLNDCCRQMDHSQASSSGAFGSNALTGSLHNNGSAANFQAQGHAGESLKRRRLVQYHILFTFMPFEFKTCDWILSLYFCEQQFTVHQTEKIWWRVGGIKPWGLW